MSKQGIALVTGPGFGEIRTISAQIEQLQCQAMNVYYTRMGTGARCPAIATVNHPRGTRFCWVHEAAFNNPNRARRLHLHKSVTE